MKRKEWIVSIVNEGEIGIIELAKWVQELVRCKDCTHGKPGVRGDGVVCYGVWHENDWFCADGERKRRFKFITDHELSLTSTKEVRIMSELGMPGQCMDILIEAYDKLARIIYRVKKKLPEQPELPEGDTVEDDKRTCELLAEAIQAVTKELIKLED